MNDTTQGGGEWVTYDNAEGFEETVFILADGETMEYGRNLWYDSYHNPPAERGGGSYELMHTDDGQWFWWPCWPGCVPDTDACPTGPFATRDDAVADIESAFLDAGGIAAGGLF